MDSLRASLEPLRQHESLPASNRRGQPRHHSELKLYPPHAQTSTLGKAPGLVATKSALSLKKDSNRYASDKKNKNLAGATPNVLAMKMGFDDRTSAVVGRYSYSLPKKSLGSLQKATFRGKQRHLGKAMMEASHAEYGAGGPAVGSHLAAGVSVYARGTFGNDKHHFWSEVDPNWDAATPPTREELREQELKMRQSRSRKELTKKVQKQRKALDAAGHPHLRRPSNNFSTLQPTPMPGSFRNRGDLPSIYGGAGEVRVVNDGRSSHANIKGEPMLIDEIQFWDASEPQSLIGSRAPSIAALEVAQGAADAAGSNFVSSSDARGRDPRERRGVPKRDSSGSISKQEMCMQLDAIRHKKEGQSPKRLQKLYALLQSSNKGKQAVGRGNEREKSYFNEQIRMSEDQARKLQKVDSKLDLYTNQASHHKDQLSRLSEAIDRFRSGEQHDDLQQQNSLDIRVNGATLGGSPRLDTQSDADAGSPTRAAAGKGSAKGKGAGPWGAKGRQAAVLADPWGSGVKALRDLGKSNSHKRLKDKGRRGDRDDALEEGQEDLPLFAFNDNLDLHSFLGMTVSQQYGFRVQPGVLEGLFRSRLPYVMNHLDTFSRFNPERVEMKGWWEKLMLTGSGQPVCRENATLMFGGNLGYHSLYLIGGAPVKTGAYQFEVFRINPSKKQWVKVEQRNPIVQHLGSRPVFNLDPVTQDFQIFSFSGMAPMQRINSGVRVCPPDLHMTDSKTWKWNRLNTGTSRPVEGRKNFAISYCQDQIFVSGGMDNGQNIISDLIMFSLPARDWTEFKQLRKKTSDVESAHVLDTSPDRRGYDSAGEQQLSALPTLESEATRDIYGGTKFTVDTQSTFEKKKVVPNPAMQQGALEQKKRKLLRRSHHTICTFEGQTTRMRHGYLIVHYVSYVFGGYIQEADGRLNPTNDLIEVVTKALKWDGYGEQPPKPAAALTRLEEAQVSLVAEKAGARPMPRRDHSAIMISNNRYLLVYGGKNDGAYKYELAAKELATSKNAADQRDSQQRICLDDLMLFNFETLTWSAVAQHGFIPDGRWSAALTYSEASKQLYVFGGSGSQGCCSNEVYCCELNPETVAQQEHRYRSCQKEVEQISKRLKVTQENTLSTQYD